MSLADVSNQLAKQLLDAAPDPSVVIDEKGLIVYVNARVKDVLGYEFGELIGQQVEALLPERFRAAHGRHRVRYFSNPHPRPMGSGLELSALTKEGDEVAVEISLSPLKTAQALLVSANIRDVSKQKELARQLAEANRAKSRFLAAASHDLRQPIQALNLFNAAARRSVTERAHLEIIEKQQRSLDSMARLLNALLDIGKLEAGMVRPDIEDFAVQEIFDELRVEFEEQARLKGVDLVIESCDDVARSDLGLVSQILGNLISNAIRYTREGVVRLRCLHEAVGIRFEVLDTGFGIAPEELENIFQEFYQLDTGTSRPEGLGLGLSIVRRTAQLLGHHLAVRSKPGEGSVFSLTVPRGDRRRVPATQTGGGKLRNVADALILIIDDEVSVADATRMLLTLEGFKVLVATGQREALDCLSGQTPELLIADYHLRNGETGMEAIRGIRETSRLPIPAILVSGDTSDVNLPSDLKDVGFLTKPVDTEELLNSIRRQLQTR
jgi:PAS domain S-box-containing protein